MSPGYPCCCEPSPDPVYNDCAGVQTAADGIMDDMGSMSITGPLFTDRNCTDCDETWTNLSLSRSPGVSIGDCSDVGLTQYDFAYESETLFCNGGAILRAFAVRFGCSPEFGGALTQVWLEFRTDLGADLGLPPCETLWRANLDLSGSITHTALAAFIQSGTAGQWDFLSGFGCFQSPSIQYG